MPTKSSRPKRALWQLALCCLLSAAPVAPETRSAVERLALTRLAAAHADAARYAAQRRELGPLPGLVDYRAVFHAHAGDSEHTGGSRDEILADAGRAGVSIVFLADHHRPPRDFMESWRGVRDGVLFVPGSEARGLLLHPDSSVIEHMDEPLAELVARVEQGTGMAFLSHVEERRDTPADGLTGMEIYNRHADAFDDRPSMSLLVSLMTDPDGQARLRESLALYPAELLASQVHRPHLYLERWDRETRERRLVGIAANDCHHNQVFVLIKIDDDSVRLGTVVDDEENMRVLTVDRYPRLREVTAGHQPGDEIARFDFDPYRHAMLDVSTHVLAPELTETAVREAVAQGRVYVSHDWIADPTGFRFGARQAGRTISMGDELPYVAGLRLEASLPLVADVRLLRDGEEIARVHADRLAVEAQTPGVYRLEAHLVVDGETRPWIYSNPIYLRRGGAGSTEVTPKRDTGALPDSR